MGQYFLVIKKIGKRRYYYRQRVWKEDGKTRTHSIYLGPVDRIMNLLFPKPDKLETPREAFHSYMSNSPAERALIEKFFDVSEVEETEQSDEEAGENEGDVQ